MVMERQMQRWSAQTTVAAVIEREDQFLLVEEDTADGLRLNNPSGHLDPGESLVQACARETLEEAAWVFRPTALVGIYLHRFRSSRGADLTYLRFGFCGELGKHDVTLQMDKGVVRSVWMTYEEIKACPRRHRTPHLLQCVEDYRRGCRYPLELLTTNANVYGLPPLVNMVAPDGPGSFGAT